MVADVADHIVQRIHRLIDRMHVARFQPLGRHVVAERAALNDVAVVHQHRVGSLLARLLDQAGGAHQAEFIGWRVLVVIEVHHVAVQVGGFQHAQVDGGRLRRGAHQQRKRGQRQDASSFWALSISLFECYRRGKCN